MKKRGKVLLVLSATMVTLVGSVLPVSAAPTYADIFDAEYYAENYSDVAAAFGDNEEALFNHYVNYGIYEGRVGSEAFNVLNYRENYADLEAAYGDNWKSYVDHYLTFGLAEGRDSGGMFDAVSYANRYSDLKEAYGYDVTKLWAHYEQFGIKEGRNPVSQTVVNEWAATAAKAESTSQNNSSSENPKEDTSGESSKEVQAPLVLSGNAEDVYTTTRPEYIETEKFIIFMEEGITINGNIVELIEQLMLMTEEQTGLSISTEDGLIYMQNEYGANWLFGDYFTDIDPKGSKFHIYVVSPDTCGSCGTAGCVVLNNIDLDIAGGEGWVFVHEYTHALQLTNHGCLGRVMDEGFATYTCGQVINNNPDFYFNFNANLNYSYYNREITAENAEAIFIEEKADGWEDYLYGYRFMTFLQEEYGSQAVRDIMVNTTSNEGSWACGGDSSLAVPYIKARTSDDVFAEFANWLEENKERIDAWSYEY